jgi:hypothetical protein
MARVKLIQRFHKVARDGHAVFSTKRDWLGTVNAALEDLNSSLVNVHGFDLSALKFTRGEAIKN